MESATRILSHVRDQRPVFEAVLRRMVDAESPSSDPDSHRLVIAVLREALAELDYSVRTARADSPYRHVYARRNARRKGLQIQLVLGHFDTVWPLGTTARRPFESEDGKIRGPGVFDMKGGIAQLLVALRTIKDLDLPLPLEPVIFLNADEEIGSRTSTRRIRSLATRAQRAFVLEPALGEEGLLKTERKGIGRFTISIHGKAAHAGLDPRAGASAILELSHVIQSLFALNDEEKGVTVNVGTVDGGQQPNVIAAFSQAIVDVRVSTAADAERVTRAIHDLQPATEGVRLVVEGGIGRPAMEQTPRNTALWVQARQLGKEMGIDLGQVKAGGGSDGNTASQYTATLDGLGPVGHGAHADHEFLYIDRTLERAALLTMLLLAPSSAE